VIRIGIDDRGDSVVYLARLLLDRSGVLFSFPFGVSFVFDNSGIENGTLVSVVFFVMGSGKRSRICHGRTATHLSFQLQPQLSLPTQ